MLNHHGLRKRPTYNGLVDHSENQQDTITYPDRNATGVMNDMFLNEFHEEYQSIKSMRFMVINDKSNHVYFSMDKSVNVNINSIRE